MSAAATLIPSFIPLLMVAAMRRAEQRICRQLTEAGALTAESAIQVSLARSIDRRRLEGLVSGGAIHPAAGGRHFLDPEGLRKFHDDRQRRVILAGAIVVSLIGIGVVTVLALR